MQTNEQNQQSSYGDSLGSVREAIFEINQLFIQAMAKGDAAGVADCYTTDAEFMPPGTKSAVGRAAIQAVIQTYIDQGITEYTILSTDVYGDTGIVGVKEAYMLSQPGGGNKDVGKSIQLWREEDGAWRIFRDCFNSDLTA